MHLHESLTQAVIIGAVERSMHGLDDPGFCIECGAEASGVEPDAERYECECCGAAAVYGAQELLIMTVA